MDASHALVLEVVHLERTTLSEEGQITLPKALCQAKEWEAGQEFLAIETDEGLLLKPHQPFPATQLSEVAGCLKYDGPAKTLEEFEDAIATAIQKEWI